MALYKTLNIFNATSCFSFGLCAEKYPKTIKKMNNQKLFESCTKNDIESLKRLLKTGIDVNMKDEHGYTPLITAIVSENSTIFNLLLDNDADMNLTDKLGNTPLMHSVETEDLSIIKKLLKKGADVNKANNNGRTALFLEITPEITQLLIDYGANINVKDKEGQTPLIYFSIYDYLDIIEVLVENGADINATNNYGATALMEASGDTIEPGGNGNYDIVKYLLSKKANTEIKDLKGKTALDYAKKNSDHRITELISKCQ